jgi:hypothetical protein
LSIPLPNLRTLHRERKEEKKGGGTELHMGQQCRELRGFHLAEEGLLLDTANVQK